MPNIDEELIKIEQKEFIKLIKNTRGYSWEIKLLEINIDRLQKLNNEMESKFGVII